MRTISATSSVDLGKHHRVRRLVGEPGKGVAVLPPHCFGRSEALAEPLGENRQGNADPRIVTGNRLDQNLYGHSDSATSFFGQGKHRSKVANMSQSLQHFAGPVENAAGLPPRRTPRGERIGMPTPSPLL